MTLHVLPEGDRPARPPTSRPSPGPGAISAVEWSWCLDLLPPFAALLDVAAGLTTAQQRPGEEAETGGPLLNLYLVACALDQVLSDHLHRGFLDLTALSGMPALRAASRVQQAVRAASVSLREGGLLRRQRELAALTRSLAGRILAGERAAGREASAAVARLRSGRWPARLARERPQVPRCFRGADLYPEDAAALAGRASGSIGGRRAALLVVGLRPSGQYLAPLCAAALERLGHERVDLLSLRPGAPLLAAEARRARRVAASGGWALVAGGDDGGVEAARGVLAGLGFAGSRIEALTPGGEGRIDVLLADGSVEAWLNRPAMLERLGAAGAVVVRGHRFGTAGEMPAVGTVARRRPGAHALKLVEVELRRGEERWTDLLLARGVGLGLFGYHSWLVAACLGDHVPEVLGINEGVLLMRWEPGHGPPDPVQPGELAEIAGYVAARARRLDLGPARSGEASGAGVRRVARLLTGELGRAAGPAAVRVADALTRQVHAPRRAVVDGRLGPDEWLRSPHGLIKVDFEEHGFDAGDRRVTDPLYDVATAVIGFRLEPDEERQLVEAYVRPTSDSDNLDARMAVHKLLAGSMDLSAVPALGLDLGTRAGRAAYAREVVIRETLLTRTVNGYLAAVHLDGVGPDGRGGAWVMDLDGVVESDGMGFECASPASARMLRALLLHGRQVYLTSGLSLGEVRERCQAFGLPGGVAEHGAVVWDDRRREAVSLLGAGARQALTALREALLEETDMLVDPRCRHSLSLFRPAGEGRVGVDAAAVRAVIARRRLPGLEVVEERRRTAVRAAGLDVRAALGRLHAAGAATGDLRAAARALHGRTSACRRCRLPALAAADRTLMEVLSLRDLDRLGRLAYVLRPGALRAFEM